MLAPIFDEAAESVKKEFPQAGKVVLAKVDCDSETAISNQYQISKYPTLKLFRDGQMMKKVEDSISYSGFVCNSCGASVLSSLCVEYVVLPWLALTG